jgi:hypothetical protein
LKEGSGGKEFLNRKGLIVNEETAYNWITNCTSAAELRNTENACIKLYLSTTIRLVIISNNIPVISDGE